MNCAAKAILTAAIRAARQIDPQAAEELDVALATVGRRQVEQKPGALLLTQAQVAHLLGCSRWTVRNLVADGQLHPVVLRGAKRYRRAEILRLAGEAA